MSEVTKKHVLGINRCAFLPMTVKNEDERTDVLIEVGHDAVRVKEDL